MVASLQKTVFHVFSGCFWPESPKLNGIFKLCLFLVEERQKAYQIDIAFL